MLYDNQINEDLFESYGVLVGRGLAPAEINKILLCNYVEIFITNFNINESEFLFCSAGDKPPPYDETMKSNRINNHFSLLSQVR